MQISTKAIVLSQTKYGDNDAIVKFYTLKNGIQTFYVRSIRSKKNQKVALLAPLNKLEIIGEKRENKSLASLKQISCYEPYKTIGLNFYKSTVALFLGEFLGKTLVEELADENLFAFIDNALSLLDTTDNFANFHLVFLAKYAVILGIGPQNNFEAGYGFNIKEGYFEPPSFKKEITVNHEVAFLISRFFGDTFENLLELPLNRTQRKALLNALILFFQTQFNGIGKINSTEILEQVME